MIALFGAFVRRARAVRRLGSAALDLCYVAAGRFDGFWEDRLKPWDIAAGGADRRPKLAASCPGWTALPFDVRKGDLVATNAALRPQMLEVIRAHASPLT